MIEQQEAPQEAAVLTVPKRHRGVRLTNRDLDALRWIGEQYIIRFDQLRWLLARLSPEPKKLRNESGLLSVERTRRVLRRWEAEGLIQYRLFLVGEKGWIWLSRKGLGYVGLQVRYYDPKPVSLQHLFYIAQARLYVEQRRPDDKWISERTLRASQESREKGEVVDHLPDGIVQKPDGERIAIEVELVSKSKARLLSILKELGAYYRVWYFAADSVLPLLTDAVSALPEGQKRKIQVLSAEERLDLEKWMSPSEEQK